MHPVTLAFRVGRAFWWLWMTAACCLGAVVIWLEFVAPPGAGSDPPRTLGEKLTNLGIVAAILGLGLLFRVLLRKTEARMLALVDAARDRITPGDGRSMRD